MVDLTDRIAQLALFHYSNELPTKGKPGEREWTVYAALVAEDRDNLWVVCSATGTKCTAQRCQGNIVHDAHAEVLVRRGFVRVLWQEINSFTESDLDRRLLDRIIEPSNRGNSTTRWHLKQDLQLYMYISDSPCGDASIYPVRTTNQTSNHDGKSNTSHPTDRLSFTGAKVIVSNATETCQLLQSHSAQQHLAREEIQQLGQLRSKSGRSNLDESRRSFSMSCSDKLVRWSVLGLQGQVLSALIPQPIRLMGIVVSLDPRAGSSSEHLHALQRAIPQRVVSTFEALPKDNDQSPVIPTVSITEHVFARGKAVVEHSMQSAAPSELHKSYHGKKRKREDDSKTCNPCGMAIHWQQCHPTVELLVGARGLRQGKKPKSDDDIPKLRSRLSRSSLFELARKSRGSILMPQSASSYQEWKHQIMGSDAYASRKRAVLTQGPLSGWLVASPSGDFPLTGKKESMSRS